MMATRSFPTTAVETIIRMRNREPEMALPATHSTPALAPYGAPQPTLITPRNSIEGHGDDQPLHVLVVDDDTDDRRIMIDQLNTLGTRATSASKLGDIKRQLDRDHCDLLILYLSVD